MRETWRAEIPRLRPSHPMLRGGMPGVKAMTVYEPIRTGTEFQWKAGPGTIKSQVVECDPHPTRPGLQVGDRAPDGLGPGVNDNLCRLADGRLVVSLHISLLSTRRCTLN